MPKGVYPRTAWHRQRVSEGSRGKVLSEAHKAAIAAGGRGRKHSQETKAKIGAAHRGIKETAQAVENSKAGVKKAFPEGRKMSQEARNKLSAAGLGRVHSEQTRAKRSMSLRGKKRTPQQCENIRQAIRSSEKHKAIVSSPEYRSHMSEALKGRVISPLHRERIGTARAAWLAQHKGPWRETSLEKCLRKLLLNQGVTDLQPCSIDEPQVRFGRYVVDFYSPSRRTAYEADGTYWHRNPEKDQARDAYILERFGVTVVRFAEAELQ